MGSPSLHTIPVDETTVDNSMSELFLTLRKRKWILIVAAVVGLVWGCYRAVTQPHLYTAYGRIQVRAGSSDQYRVISAGGGDGGTTRMPTEESIIGSDSLVEHVARDLDLPNDPAFTGAKGKHPRASMDDPEVRISVVHTLQENLKIILVPKTEIIFISYESLDPKLSANIVNRLIADYIQRSYETRFASTQRVSSWLSGQLNDLKQEVEASQEQMMAVQRRLGVLGFDTTHSQINSSLETLSSAAGSARIARIIAESRYRVLAGMDPDTMGINIDTTPGTTVGAITGLRSALATAQTQYATLMAQYGPNHPSAIALKTQIDALQSQVNAEQSRLLAQAKQNYITAKASEDQTTDALEKLKTDAYKLQDDAIELSLRQREFEANRNLYEGLRERLRTAGVQAGLESVEIDIVDPAVPPAKPTLKSIPTTILTTIIFTLLIGIALTFLLESLDSGMHTITEAELATGLPTLAVLPRERRGASGGRAAQAATQQYIDVLSKPKSQYAEGIRSLRTSLLLSTTEHPPKILLFTSATPAEGKTTTATNAACVLAQANARVLLIDADLRRPNVHHRFGLSGRLGLSNILAGSVTLEAAVQHVPEVPGLDVLASGPIPPFPTEMLGSRTMEGLIKRAGELYDFVVIDSPPVLSVTDSVVLAHHADAVALIVRYGKVSKQGVRRGRDLLVRAGAKMTGIILNAVDLSSPEYRSYYGYSSYSYSAADTEAWESEVHEAKHTKTTGGE